MGTVATMPGSGPPPNDIAPDELWIRLSQEERPVEIVDFPRKDAAGTPIGQIAIWVLKQGEIILAKAEATRRARKIIAEKFDSSERIEGYTQVLEDETACQLLFQCCRRPTNHNLPIFPTADGVRQKLTSDEVAVLLNSYAIVQSKLGPIPESMDEPTMDAWVDRLRVGGSQVPLSFLSREQLSALLMYSVSRSSASPEARSFVGSPPEEPTSTS